MTQLHRAATVLVLRPAAGDIEVLMVRRGQRASFMANAYVFPGGRVDDADGQLDPELASRRCAARELLEEASLQVADLGELVYFARWMTPALEPRRFDADFFLWELPPDQTPRVDDQEVFDLRWYTPAAALALYEAGQLNLPPPTACTLEELQAEFARLPSGEASLPQLLARLGSRHPHSLLPKLQPSEGGELEVVMPWDPGYPAMAGQGSAASGLSTEGDALPGRICRCILAPPGIWRVKRLPL